MEHSVTFKISIAGQDVSMDVDCSAFIRSLQFKRFGEQYHLTFAPGPQLQIPSATAREMVGVLLDMLDREDAHAILKDHEERRR